ncbi:MAG: N-acyl homoserine lactonase family protein [Gammaproteobacteria bacterium]|jgi:glyoxylase-like metal-dependent hydrolase (beta-lactamase superfamily II)|nr:N-acyl homoserine lactonase family protein [Gammaproteobacteria bacterium]MBT6043203.1 N-acyl homoserine lactonase family protein [Gammaproteobacteria bacterium]
MSALEPFEVYAIRYACVDRKASENFLGGDPHEAGMPMDYFVWMARSKSKTWVIDTGFNQQAAVKREREFLRSPAEGLGLLGVDVNNAEDVIITHLHYDHIGNFDLFPKAQFHLQDSEMAYATGRYMANPLFGHAFEEDEIVAMVRNVYKGRVSFYDGDAELAPNISVHHVGGHTKGLQVVRLWTRKGWLVLASDASHYAANMNERRPFPIVVDVAQMIDGWDKMKTLVEDPANIIPGHDPEVMNLYPAPSAELEGIAVRLD